MNRSAPNEGSIVRKPLSPGLGSLDLDQGNQYEQLHHGQPWFSKGEFDNSFS